MKQCADYSNGHMAGLDTDHVMFAHEKTFELLNVGGQPLDDTAREQLALIANNANLIIKIKYDLIGA